MVGVRLLLLWRHTRELPELTIGLAFVLAGFVGGVLIHLGTVLNSAVLGRGAVATLHAGALCLAVFTWRVFRPDALWAGSLVAALAAGAGLALLGGSGYGTEGAARGGTIFWLGFVCRAAPFGWAALESGLYYTRMRRRAQIGLADADVARRFLFWAVGSGCVFWIWCQSGTLIALGHDPNLGGPLLVRSLIGLVAAGALWCAFFPRSARLLRWTR
jgi:hypothetical protein